MDPIASKGNIKFQTIHVNQYWQFNVHFSPPPGFHIVQYIAVQAPTYMSYSLQLFWLHDDSVQHLQRPSLCNLKVLSS